MAKMVLPFGASGNREDEDDLLNDMITGPEPRTMPPPVNQPMDEGGINQSLLPGPGQNTGVGGPFAGGPVGSTPSPMAAPSTPAAPSGGARRPGGALANYGTANIAGAENVSYGDTSRLRGFNTNEWGPGGTEGYEDSSIKNTFGKIASRYDSKPSSLQSIISDPDFQKYFPEATIVGFDKIDFGDGNPVDVLISADPNSDSAEGWAWQTGDGGGVAAGNVSAPMGGSSGGSGLDALLTSGAEATNPDTLAAIMAQIDALSNGQNPMEEDELNKLLAGI